MTPDMPFPVLNVQSNLASPPEDEVHLKIKADRSRCTGVPAWMTQRLDDLEANGLKVPISRLIAYAGMHYKGNVADFWNRGTDYAQVRHAWDNLGHLHPQAVLQPKTNMPKLVVQHQTGTVGGNKSELLGVGVGLYVARRLYDIPYRFWYPTTPNARYDYSAPAQGGGVTKIEVRGRFGRRNWAKAIAEVHNKLAVGGNFVSAAGIIFAPRDTPRTKAEDVLVIDPPGQGIPTDDSARYRALMRHYAPFFERQGFVDVADRLVELANADLEAFEQYLAHGDDFLRSARMHRTFFVLEGFRFEGTAWEDIAWPQELTGIPLETGQGAFYWGLWDEVIAALREGNLRDIADMDVRPLTLRGDRRVYVVQDDATAFKWAPTPTELRPSD